MGHSRFFNGIMIIAMTNLIVDGFDCLQYYFLRENKICGRLESSYPSKYVDLEIMNHDVNASHHFGPRLLSGTFCQKYKQEKS